MSISALNWAWSQEAPTSTAKLVLVALADHANGDGECWPSMGAVADLAQCSTRQVSRCVDSLEAVGLVSRKRRRMNRGRMGSYVYQLPVTTGHTRPLDTDDHRTPEATTTGHPRPSPPDTSVRSEPPVEPPSEPKPSKHDFDADFWEPYPLRHGKKVGQKQAREQWRKLNEHDRGLAAAAVVHYAAAANDPAVFCPVKDPWRWLRDRLFDDWQEPAQPRAGPSRLHNVTQIAEGGRF